MYADKKITVTGSSGFIGSALCSHLSLSGYDLIGTVRSESIVKSNFRSIAVGEIDGNTDWSAALRGRSTVVHLAGRAHVLRDGCDDPLSEFRRVNTVGSINLAKQAIESGITRFIFISSISCNGFITTGNRFSIDSQAAPHSPYAVSKLEAETELKKLAAGKKMELVIVRPPAVYGADSPGNFRLLARAIKKGIPLPFLCVDNRRSFIHVRNLVSFIEACIISQGLEDELFIVDDNEDLSTPEMIELMAVFLEKEPKMMRVPIWMLRLLFSVAGRSKTGDSLLSDLQLDSTYARERLDWSPPFNPKKVIKVWNSKRM